MVNGPFRVLSAHVCVHVVQLVKTLVGAGVLVWFLHWQWAAPICMSRVYMRMHSQGGVDHKVPVIVTKVLPDSPVSVGRI